MLSCRSCGWFGSNTGPLAYCPECGSRYLRSAHSQPAETPADPQAELEGKIHRSRLWSVVLTILVLLGALFISTRLE